MAWWDVFSNAGNALSNIISPFLGGGSNIPSAPKAPSYSPPLNSNPSPSFPTFTPSYQQASQAARTPYTPIRVAPPPAPRVLPNLRASSPKIPIPPPPRIAASSAQLKFPNAPSPVGNAIRNTASNTFNALSHPIKTVQDTITNQLTNNIYQQRLDQQVKDIYKNKFGTDLGPTWLQRVAHQIGATGSDIAMRQRDPAQWNKLTPAEKDTLNQYKKQSDENMINFVTGMGHGGTGSGKSLVESLANKGKTGIATEGENLAKGALSQTQQSKLGQLVEGSAGSSEPRILPQNEIVKNGPFNMKSNLVKNVTETNAAPSKLSQVFHTTPQDQLASDIRSTFSGTKNAQIVRGNQLADTIKQIVPNAVDRQAMFWYKAANGDTKTITQALKDPRFADHVPALQRALNLPINAKTALQLGEHYYTQAGQVSKNLGSIHNVLENYQNRIYQPEKTGGAINASLGGGIKTSTTHGLQRVFPTEFDAVKAGKKFATTDFADALAIHNQELAGVNTSRQLTKAMSNAKLGKWVNPGEIPEGWKPVEGLTNKVPFIDKATGKPRIAIQQFSAPEHLATGLKAVTEPNFVKKIDSLRGVQKYQGLVKTVDLAYSFFHHATLTAQMLYQTKGGLDIIKDLPNIIKSSTSGEFNKLEQDFVQHTGITTKVSDNQDVMRNLLKGDDNLSKALNVPGVKQVTQLAEKNSNFLFGTVQRYLKVSDYSSKISSWIAKHPNSTNEAVLDAKRSIAKEVNAAYGGLNWEAMGVTKSAQSLLRLALLAPDWTVSNLQLGKMALSGGPGGAAARSHIVTAVLGGILATEMLSKTVTGHFTDQNKKGHEGEVEIAPNVYVSLFRGPIGDMMKLASNVAENGIGGGLARFAQGKLSPLARTLIGALSNTNYAGQNITKPGQSFGKNTLDFGKFVGQSVAPVPFGITAGSQEAGAGGATLPGMIATLTGLARYSPGSGYTATPTYKGNFLRQFSGTPQEKQQFQTQSSNQKFLEGLDLKKKDDPTQKQKIEDYLGTLKSDADRKSFAYKLSKEGYSIKGIHTSATTIQAAKLYKDLSKLSPDEADAKAEQLSQDNPDLYDALVREVKKANLTPEEEHLTTLGIKNGERAKAIMDSISKLNTNATKNAYLKGLEDKGVITDPVKQQVQDLIKNSSTPDLQTGLTLPFVSTAYAKEVTPNTPVNVAPIIVRAAKTNGVPPKILAAIAEHESGGSFDPNINQQGGGLGRGMFQIDLGQHPDVSESQAKSPTFAANYAARLLKDDYNRFGNWDDAIKAYNAGDPYSQEIGYNGQPIWQIANDYLSKIKGILNK